MKCSARAGGPLSFSFVAIAAGCGIALPSERRRRPSHRLFRRTRSDAEPSTRGWPAPTPTTSSAEPAAPPSFWSHHLGDAPPPPAISGGTLLILHDGRTAFAADPDRDAVYIADLQAGTLSASIALAPGDEPGRATEDSAGLVHVVLRRGGAVADIDPQAGTLLARRPVCPAPRGIAFDPTSGDLYVACAGGELVTLSSAGGAPSRSLTLDADLRDVAVLAGQVYVSRFRSAEVLSVDADGNVVSRLTPVVGEAPDGTAMLPQVAWRMIATGSPPTGLMIVHQRLRAHRRPRRRPITPTPATARPAPSR